MTMLLGVVTVSACGGEAEPAPEATTAEQEPEATLPAFESCPNHPKGRGGGGDGVWVQGMKCSQVTTELLISMPDAFGRYKSLPLSKRMRSVKGPDGWVCWAALESDYGPIHDVCRRGDQTLIFYEG
ncbi:MAG: hypothetical protein M3450_06550 [Actinomycetota bacterium]|nr:hypothetical protein [Actinomycetota bacterium]